MFNISFQLKLLPKTTDFEAFLPYFGPKTPKTPKNSQSPKTPKPTKNSQLPKTPQKLPTAKNLSMHRLGVSFAKNP
jgi:hypothetical protein